MTETQAMSETAGTPANPADQDTKPAASKPAESKATPASAEAPVAKGRATVPAEKPDKPPASTGPSAMGPSSTGSAPTGSAPTGSAPTGSAPTGSAPTGSAPTGPASTGPTFTRPAGMPASADDAGGKKGAKGGKVDKAAPLGRTAMGAATLRSVVNSATAGAVRVTEAVRAARSTATVGASRGPRRARLSLKRVDPWSVMKFSFAVSFVLLVVIIVATSVLYLALDAMGVFDSVNKTLAELFSSNGGGEPFKITAGLVIGSSAILGAINVVLFTALMTLGAFVYNVCADLVGGVEVTLAERD